MPTTSSLNLIMGNNADVSVYESIDGMMNSPKEMRLRQQYGA